MNDSEQTQPHAIVVGDGYPTLQLAKALVSSDSDDVGIRKRARAKATRWIQVLTGLQNGSLRVGSRAPLKDTPVWLTPEVVTGGFATGNLMAGGPLLPFESELLGDRAGKNPDLESDRKWLNSYFLSEDGLDRLMQQLQSGRFEITAPEEGALLAFAWLVRNGHTAVASSLLETISPYFHRVRFYPRPSTTPIVFGEKVFLRSVGEVSSDLKQVRPNQNLLAQREAITVWQPLYDRTVALFLTTVIGEPPRLSTDEAERISVAGGFPSKMVSSEFAAAAMSLLSEYNESRKTHKRCNRPRRKDNFAQLREFLAKAVHERTFTEADSARIRMLLARYITQRGLPESAELRQLRDRQRQQVSGPIFSELAKVLVARLAQHAKSDGVEEIHSIVAPITHAESERYGIASETEVPTTLLRKLRRCVRTTVDVLIDQGVIPSGDTLAEVLPQMTSGLRAAGIRDNTFRRLYAAIDQAFGARRSLLLLNFESQIRIEELPWIQAMNQFRDKNLSGVDAARASMREIVRITLTAFPYAILPNKLLRELRGLAKTAHVELPLVDELAADIFMGEFSNKFVNASKISAQLLQGTLYERYYGIDFSAIASLKVSTSRRRRSTAFASLCAKRAGVKAGGWDVVANGMMIEQQQILTTQNLAAVYARLDMADSLDGHLPTMAKSTFDWVLQRLQIKTDHWHASLIHVKNAAYAWRQMIFYLSLMRADWLAEFHDWANQRLLEQPATFASRFRSTLDGLRRLPRKVDQGASRFWDGQQRSIHCCLNRRASPRDSRPRISVRRFLPSVNGTQETNVLLLADTDQALDVHGVYHPCTSQFLTRASYAFDSTCHTDPGNRFCLCRERGLQAERALHLLGRLRMARRRVSWVAIFTRPPTSTR